MSGSSTLTVIPSFAGSGSGVQLNGGLDLASTAWASFWLETLDPRLSTVELTVNPARDAAFNLELVGSGRTYATRKLLLRRVPGSDALQALSTSGTVSCGALPSGQSTEVTLAVDAAAHTFDVLIAGARSACTDLPTKLLVPLQGFRLVDLGNQGYGGRIDFTNLGLF
jgi:hypothetical protein